MAATTLVRTSMEQQDEVHNRHFVQALHDFFPANAPEDNASGCLFFQRGAIIEVYNRDASGWWDGSCDGLRGWFPSNFVGRLGDHRRVSADFDDNHDTNPHFQEYQMWRQQSMDDTGSASPPPASPALPNPPLDSDFQNDHHVNKVELAKAILDADRQQRQFDQKQAEHTMEYLLDDVNNRILDLVDDCQQDSAYVNIQMAIFRVVSSIRSVLTAANTVTKDSPLLKTFPELARQRKVVLAILRKLVLKGKEVRAGNGSQPDDTGLYALRQRIQQEIPPMANQLTIEMGVFESILRQVLPPTAKNDKIDKNNDDLKPLASSRHAATARQRVSSSSTSSSTHSSTHSNSDNEDGGEKSSSSLRQQLMAARLSSTSLIAKAVPLYDAEHILETIAVHQASIDLLVPTLLGAVDMFLSARRQATHMLETTRKVVEAVRNFLAVVEHVCSNVGHLDYKHHSIIPEDPLLVALVLTKEDVYTAITNLVTAVRALTAPSRACRDSTKRSLASTLDDDASNDENDAIEDEDDEDALKEDRQHLQASCSNILTTIQHCSIAIRRCLLVDQQQNSQNSHQSDNLSEMRDRLENSVDTRRQQTLSILGRKVTSLNALQRRYGDENEASAAITAAVVAASSSTNSLLCDTRSITYSVASPNASTNDLSASNPPESPIAKRQSSLPRPRSTASSTSSIANDLPPRPPMPHGANGATLTAEDADERVSHASSRASSIHTHPDDEISVHDASELPMNASELPLNASDVPLNESTTSLGSMESMGSASAIAHSVLQGYQRHRTQSNPSKLPDRPTGATRTIRSFHGRSTRLSSEPRANTARSSLNSTASPPSVTSTQRSTLTSNRSSLDSSMTTLTTPMTTPEALKPVQEIEGDDVEHDENVHLALDASNSTTPTASTTSLVAITPFRQRSSSIFAGQQAQLPPQPLSPKRMMPLPPVPPTPVPVPATNDQPKMASSKSTPTADPVKQRRPRGMSVSALRMSLKNNGKVDDAKPSQDASPLQHKSSLSSMQSNDRQSLTDGKNGDELPWFLHQRSFEEEELLSNAQGQVTGATIEALIEHLTLHGKAPDLVLTRAFFYNFRLFTTPMDLVQLLIKRFRLAAPTHHPDGSPLSEDELTLWKTRVLLPVRLRVYNVIKTWMESYFRPDQDHVKDELLAFAEQDMRDAMPGPANRMVNLIRQTFQNRDRAMSHSKMSYAIWSTASSLFNSTNSSLISLHDASSSPSMSHHHHPGGAMTMPSRPPMQSKTSSISLSSGSSLFSDLSLFGNDHAGSSSSSSDALNYPPVLMARSLRNMLRKALQHNNPRMVHINDFDCTELARQLTLMESALFCQVTPYELIGQEFKKKLGESTAIHVKAMILKSTQITSWVSDSILRETELKRRVQLIKFWIKVADACLQLNNYNTLMAIRSALDSTSIRRLKRTWDGLSSKYKLMMEPIYRATDSSRNFADYRSRLKMAVAPCLPFLGVYLTDMTFIDDGNSNVRVTPNGTPLINFDKYIKTTRVLNEIDQFQIPYRLLEVEEIQAYLTRCLDTVDKDEQVYYEKSLKIEPREEEYDIGKTIQHIS